MNYPSQDDLLGYVLGALDAQEQRDVQQQIDQNPELEERLLEIKSSLLPLDLVETAGPRPGLARRTIEFVATSQIECDDPDNAASLKPSVTTGSLESDRRSLLLPSTWSLTDVAASIGLIAVLAGLLFPTLAIQRYNSRIEKCQNNMRQIGNALIQYSNINGGQFVEIPRTGNLAVVGSFAPILKDQGLIEDDSLFACAGKTSGDDLPVRIPTLELIRNAEGEQLAFLQQNMCGDFGYTLGHNCSGEIRIPKNLGRGFVVLMADTPSRDIRTGRISKNHASRGQNCLFEDGHVEFVKGGSLGEDAIFLNDRNMVAPGCCPNDNVIAPSHLSPLPEMMTLTQGE